MSRNRGVTLIELLVVICVIGALIMMLLPAIKAARDVSTRMQCSSELRQLSSATLNYSINFKGAFPITVDGRGVGPNFDPSPSIPSAGPIAQRSVDGMRELFTYCSYDYRLFFCPTADAAYSPANAGATPSLPYLWYRNRQNFDGFTQTPIDFAGGYFKYAGCYDIEGNAYSRYSYAYPTNQTAADPLDPTATQVRTGYMSVNQVDNASKVKYYANGTTYNIPTKPTRLTPSKVVLFGEPLLYNRISGYFDTGCHGMPIKAIPTVQPSGLNEACGDGHVEWQNWEKNKINNLDIQWADTLYTLRNGLYAQRIIGD